MQQKDNDQFSFINEKIKEKPVNKKRLLMQAGFIALMAVVFGIIASLVSAYFQPKFESLVLPRGGTGGHHSAGFGYGDGAARGDRDIRGDGGIRGTAGAFRGTAATAAPGA